MGESVAIKIYEPGVQHVPGVVYLRLIETDPGAVMLAAVDENGDCLLDPISEYHGGGILTLAEGHIFLSPALMPSLGLSLDMTGRIKLDPWSEMLAAKHAQRFGGKRTAFRVVGDTTP